MKTTTQTRARSIQPGEPGVEQLLNHTPTDPALAAAARRTVISHLQEPDRSTVLAALGLDEEADDARTA